MINEDELFLAAMKNDCLHSSLFGVSTVPMPCKKINWSTSNPGPLSRDYFKYDFFYEPRKLSIVTGNYIENYTDEEIHLMHKCIDITKGYLLNRPQRMTEKGRDIISRKKRIKKKYPIVRYQCKSDGKVRFVTSGHVELAKIALDTIAERRNI